MSSASTFPLNKVIDTAAQRQSKLVWQSSKRNNFSYSNKSLFILEARIAPGKRKRGETHFTTIFQSEMGLVPISTWDHMPFASAVTATAAKLPVQFFQRYHCNSAKVNVNCWHLAWWGAGGGNPHRPNPARQSSLRPAPPSESTVKQRCGQVALTCTYLLGQHQSIPNGQKSHLEGGLKNYLIRFGVVQHSLQESSDNLVKYTSIFW